MKKMPSYLYRNRHGTFYFRIVIPAKLHPLTQGKREIRRSLKTDSERLALKRARQRAVHFSLIFDRALQMAEHSEYTPSAEDIELFDQLYPADDWSSPASYRDEPEVFLSNEELKERQRIHCIAQLLTGRHDRPIPESMIALADRLLELSRMYMPAELPRILPSLREELVREKTSESRRTSSSPSGNLLKVTPQMDPTRLTWTLYDVWKHQLERDRLDLTAKGGQAKHSGTQEERERRARVMTVLTNHKPVCQMTKGDWQLAYDSARKIKAGARASINPPSSLSELLTEHTFEMTGHERVTSLIGSMKQIQEHARFLDLTTIKPTDLLINHIHKRNSSRSRPGQAFKASEIEAIFSGYIYKGPVPQNRTKAYPFWYWMPLVAYFTGARTNEIAQLNTNDVREIDGHPCFDFSPDLLSVSESKRIKTDEARQVPVHPTLMRLGFLEYVSDQTEAKQKKLFGDGLTYLPPRDDEADHNKEGWAKTASKFFNESPKGYLVIIGVHKANDGKSLYSFRHTLETNLRNARRDGRFIDQTVIDAITGHVPETVASKNYDGGPTVAHKLAALELLPIPQAIHCLNGYKKDFVERFGQVLIKSVASHRNKYPRPA